MLIWGEVYRATYVELWEMSGFFAVWHSFQEGSWKRREMRWLIINKQKSGVVLTINVHRLSIVMHEDFKIVFWSKKQNFPEKHWRIHHKLNKNEWMNFRLFINNKWSSMCFFFVNHWIFINYYAFGISNRPLKTKIAPDFPGESVETDTFSSALLFGRYDKVYTVSIFYIFQYVPTLRNRSAPQHRQEGGIITFLNLFELKI